MFNYWSIAISLLLIELTRRIFLTIQSGLTGPLSKIPGPVLGKFTWIPWVIEVVRGKHMESTKYLLEKYGDVVRVAPNTVIIASKEGVHKILVEQDLGKAPFMDGMRFRPENAMLISERDKPTHKHIRRLLSPGFSISYLDGLEPLMQDCIQEFVDQLNLRCKEETAIIDMQDLLGSLTFDVMSATSLGGSFHTVTADTTNFKHVFKSVLVNATLNVYFPFLQYVPYFPKIMTDDLSRILDRVLDRKSSAEGDEKDKKDLVQIIMNAQKKDPIGFPEVRMRDEIGLFMIAGSETTSTAITGALYQLVHNPDKLQALVAEMDATFPSPEDPITFSATNAMPYLNAVVWEGLRLMAPVAGLLRYTTEPTTFGGYVIPANTTVQPWPMGVMHSPEIWPDVESFIPERWLGPYKGAVADRKDILAFSAGSRNCIGWQYAIREMRLVLARLLRDFEIGLVEGQNPERRFHSSARFTQGFYNVRITPRK